MKFLGQDVDVLKNQVVALLMNVYSWFLSFLPVFLRKPKPTIGRNKESCVVIQGPGGLDQLQHVELCANDSAQQVLTVGYNVDGFPAPFVNATKPYSFPADLVVVKIKYFSVNYADVCIRWGLYESALRYVGWPIVPGFDFAGEIEWAAPDAGFTAGESVLGFSLFGAYSSQVLVPARQLRKITPLQLKHSTIEGLAGLCAVAATALHSIALAGAWPHPLATRNRAAVVHSAAGGVGSMLVQMCKLQGFHPVIAIVGSRHKVKYCQSLGADIVVDKSATPDIWEEIKRLIKLQNIYEDESVNMDDAPPEGYAAIFDANGVETLADSYQNLSRCGRLVVYGFHTNLPKADTLLSPVAWMKMIYKMISMPKFDAMQMVLDSKAVLGFNLSFFASEHELIQLYMNQILEWIEAGKLHVPAVTTFEMKNIGQAHQLIQSGQSVGKIVIKVQQQ